MLEIFIQQMAPTHSKPIPEPRDKHVLSASLASTNNVDVTAVKQHKLEAVQHQQCQPSVQDANNDDDDNGLSSNTNLQPWDGSQILETADGSDDIQLDIKGGGDSDDNELPGLEEVDDTSNEEDKEGEEREVAETDEEELGKSPDHYCWGQLTVIFFPSVSDWGLNLTDLCFLSLCPQYHLQCWGPLCSWVSLHCKGL